MSLTAEDLIIEWVNSNTKYQAIRVPTVFSGTAVKITTIKVSGDRQIAWLYLKPVPRWNVEEGLYFMAEMAANPSNPKCHKLPPLGDPNYFNVLTNHLDNGPKPF